MSKFSVFDKYKTPDDWKRNALNTETTEKPKIRTWQFTTAVLAALAIVAGGVMISLTGTIGTSNSAGSSSDTSETRKSIVSLSDEQKEKIYGEMEKEYDCVVKGIVLNSWEDEPKITVLVKSDNNVEDEGKVVTYTLQENGCSYDSDGVEGKLSAETADKAVGTEVYLGFYAQEIDETDSIDDSTAEINEDDLRDANEQLDEQHGNADGFANLGVTTDSDFKDIAEAVMAYTGSDSLEDCGEILRGHYLATSDKGYEYEEVSTSAENIGGFINLEFTQLKTFCLCWSGNSWQREYVYITKVKNVAGGNVLNGGNQEGLYSARIGGDLSVTYNIFNDTMETPYTDEYTVDNVKFVRGNSKSVAYIIGTVQYPECSERFPINGRLRVLLQLESGESSIEYGINYPNGYEIPEEYFANCNYYISENCEYDITGYGSVLSLIDNKNETTFWYEFGLWSKDEIPADTVWVHDGNKWTADVNGETITVVVDTEDENAELVGGDSFGYTYDRENENDLRSQVGFDVTIKRQAGTEVKFTVMRGSEVLGTIDYPAVTGDHNDPNEPAD
jgi:hypothetical protein